jgi:hypothetical protein
MATEATWTVFESVEDLAAILAQGRKRGQYLPVVKDFDEMNVAGIEVTATGPFEGKTPEAIYGGLLNVTKKDEYKDSIEVRKVGDRVFLVRL